VRQNAQRPAAVSETTGYFVCTTLDVVVVVNSTARTPPFYYIGSHEPNIYIPKKISNDKPLCVCVCVCVCVWYSVALLYGRFHSPRAQTVYSKDARNTGNHAADLVDATINALPVQCLKPGFIRLHFIMIIIIYIYIIYVHMYSSRCYNRNIIF